jgi:Phage protein
VRKSAAAQPLLEINQRPIRDLKALIELIGPRRVERELNVHRTTVRRWLDGQVRIGGAQLLAVRALLGDMPGTNARWTGWRFHDGLLLSPAGDKFTAGDVSAIGLNRQRIAWLERELIAAKARVALLEQAYPQAANEERRARA